MLVKKGLVWWLGVGKVWPCERHNWATCDSCNAQKFNGATCIVGGVRALRLQPLFHFLWHLFSNVEVEFFHLYYIHIFSTLKQYFNILPTSFLLLFFFSFSATGLVYVWHFTCTCVSVLASSICNYSFFFFFHFIFNSQILHAGSLSILTDEEGPWERKKERKNSSFLNMEFGSERSAQEVKEEKRTESTLGGQEHRRQQEIVMQVKLILCCYLICLCIYVWSFICWFRLKTRIKLFWSPNSFCFSTHPIVSTRIIGSNLLFFIYLCNIVKINFKYLRRGVLYLQIKTS